MSKRDAYAAGMSARREAAKRRRLYRRTTGLSPNTMYGPVRTYGGGMAPLRTGGYRLNRAERKTNDLATGAYQVNTTGTFQLLACPQTGSDFNQRIGRKIILKSVFIRGYVATEPGRSASPPLVSQGAQMGRVIVFMDAQPNGAAPAVTDLLVEANPSSQLNLNYRDRFKVLVDKEFVFDPYILSVTASQAVCNTSKQIVPFKKYKKINMETIFGATSTGSVGDITTGALYMFWIGTSIASATDINASVSCRVRYTDN